MTLHNNFKKQAVAAAIAVSALMPFTAANADMGEDCDQKHPYHQTYYRSLLEAGNAAECYAEKEDGIGLLMGYGIKGNNTADPIKMGNAYVNEITKRGINSKYFIAPRKEKGITLSYIFGHNTEDLGPQDIEIAATNMGDAIRKKNTLDRLLLSSLN